MVKPFFMEQVASREGLSRRWFNIADFIEQQVSQYQAPLLTDDYAPVERLLGPILTTTAAN